jgi:hypothetical protein
MSVTARAIIGASSAQGRLFPQALSELLGTHPQIGRIQIDAESKAQRFTVHPSERHPVTGAVPTLLRIEAIPVDDAIPIYTWLINAETLSDLHPRLHHPLFNAARMAQELLRLYPYPIPSVSEGDEHL